MKNKFFKIWIGAIFLFIFSGCEDMFDMKADHLNPDKSTTTKIEYLFTHALRESGIAIKYGEGWGRAYPNILVWSNMIGQENGPDMMDPDVTWDSNWEDFYAKGCAHFVENELIFNTLPEGEQNNYKVFILAGQIVRARMALQMTDLWDDIPFSEASTARDPLGQNFWPKFDTQKEVYYSLLSQLKLVADELATITLNESVEHRAFQKHDILNRGDIMRWRKFANSLRLRIAMRLSEVDPAKAEAEVADVLGGNYPLIDGNEESIALVMEQTDDWQWINHYGRASYERYGWAPAEIAELMTDDNDDQIDPRASIYFIPNGAGKFVGIPASPDEQKLVTINGINYSSQRRDFLGGQNNIPAFAFTASELSFLKAEAFARGWATGNAETEYYKGIDQSVELYWYLRNEENPIPPVSDTEMATFKADPKIAYSSTDAIKLIATQKVIHLGALQPYDTYAEQRRLDYPELPVVTSGSALTWTKRVLYPDTEIINNADNYEAVKDKSDPTIRVWWDVK